MIGSDEWNLPPRLAPSGIPGNSRKEVAVGRAMEAVRDVGDDVAVVLHDAAEKLEMAFDDSAEEAVSRIVVIVIALEEIQVKLDDARNVLGRVLE